MKVLRYALLIPPWILLVVAGFVMWIPYRLMRRDMPDWFNRACCDWRSEEFEVIDR